MARDKDDLWRNFPKTAIEFDRRFATEEACRAYWIEARWGGEPVCARCGSKRVWAERGGFLFECADCQIALDTQVVTDGLASYNNESLGQRPHQAVIQTKQERRESDALQGCHWTVSLLKRWLLGTHAGAVKPKHLQAYLDEFAFRFNRRKTNGVGRIAARTIEQLVTRPPLTMKMLIREMVPCRAFRS